MVTRPYAGRRSVRCAADATKAAERRRRTPAGETTKSNAGTFNPAGDNAASDNPTDDNPTDDVSASHVPAGDNAVQRSGALGDELGIPGHAGRAQLTGPS